MEKLFPFAFAAYGRALDDIVTNFCCERFGTDLEAVKFHRAQMERQGIWQSTATRQVLTQSAIIGIGAILYIVDEIRGRESNKLNFHKVWLYGMGSLSYLAVLNNSIGYAYLSTHESK
ncbi:MAG: hypothetical protein EPN86_06370 [Nanoarchaeota archaeon]|nr:MAG: hypothetical protein EPN86_06370 [Nanoarchaeota archaeon]